MTTEQKLIVFVGSYAEAEDPGVYAYDFNESTGTFTLLDKVSGLKNPTFLNVDETNRIIYSISETTGAHGTKVGEAVSFRIHPNTSELLELNRQVTTDATTCHITRDAQNEYLVVSSYHGGKVGLLSLSEDGQIKKLLDVKQHEGHGADPIRQDRPHVHSAFFSPDNRYLFVCDLGLDLIRTYSINKTDNILEVQGDTVTAPGSGPRHLTFHPSNKFVYVINEVNSTISSFAYDQATGKLSPIATVPTLPVDYLGENTCAEIAVSQDGKFLYGSNRGHDSVVVYQLDPNDGSMAYIEHVSTEGEHPRHFALTPSGRHLIVANRDTNNLALFEVDTVTGKLQYTGQSISVSKPVCVKPVYL